MFYGTKCWVIIFHYIYQNVCNCKEKKVSQLKFRGKKRLRNIINNK